MKKSTKLVMAVAAGSVSGAAAAVLGKYAKEELDLRKEIAPEVDTTRPRIACVGDSITFGDGVVHGRDTQSYPAILETLLGGEEQVLNYGLNGRTLLAEGDMPYTKEEFYPLSKECGADTYIIMLGTNDTKPQNWNRHAYEQELVEFIRGYQKLAQAPKVGPYRERMAENLAAALNIDLEQVNVKATTEEGLGFTGDGSGMAAHAVALLEIIK